MTKVQVFLMPHAVDVPSGNEHGTGLNLVAALPANMSIVIPPGERRAIPTGLAFALPAGMEGQIRSRSGLALHYGVTVLNSPGSLGPDYRGEVHIIPANFGREQFTVERGALIAYLVVAPLPPVDWEWPARLAEWPKP